MVLSRSQTGAAHELISHDDRFSRSKGQYICLIEQIPLAEGYETAYGGGQSRRRPGIRPTSGGQSRRETLGEGRMPPRMLKFVSVGKAMPDKRAAEIRRADFEEIFREYRADHAAE